MKLTEASELVQKTQEKNYVDFKEKALEILKAKTAEKLADMGYFERLDKARGIFEDDKSEYQKFFNKTLKKYNVKSPSDLSDEEKKKFFDEIDKGWKKEDDK